MSSPILTCTTCGSPTAWTAPPGFAPRGVTITCGECAGRRVPVMGPPTLAEREAALLARIAELEAERRWRNAETETPPTWNLIEVCWYKTKHWCEFGRYCPDMERPWRKAGLEEMQPPTHWRPLGAGPSEP